MRQPFVINKHRIVMSTLSITNNFIDLLRTNIDDPHSPLTTTVDRSYSAHWLKDNAFDDNDDDDNETNRQIVGVLTPRLALGGNILQAGLTIAPATHGNLMQRTSTRRSAGNSVHSGYNSTNNSPSIAFPARHSKSFDQLRLSTASNGGHVEPHKNGHHNGTAAITIDGDTASVLRLEKSKSVMHKLNGQDEATRRNLNGWSNGHGKIQDSLPSSLPLPSNGSTTRAKYTVEKQQNSDSNQLAVMRSAYIIVSRNSSNQVKSKLNATIPDYRAMRPMTAMDNHHADVNEMRLASSVLDIKGTLDRSELPLSTSVPTKLEDLNRTIQLSSESLPNLSEHTIRSSASNSDAINHDGSSSNSNVSVNDTSQKGSLTLDHETDATTNGIYQRKDNRNRLNGILSDRFNHMKCETEDDWIEDKPMISLKALSPARSNIDSVTLTAVLQHTIANGHNDNMCSNSSLNVTTLDEKKLDFNLILLTPPDQFRDPPLDDDAIENFNGNDVNDLIDGYRCKSPTNGEQPAKQSNRSSPASDSHSVGTSQGDADVAGNDGCDGSDEADDDDCSLDLIKCRNRFREQITYSGQMYCDFKEFASELPYFHINDQYRAFSPNGLHLVVCVHGLDGSSADLRLVRTYLELGLPGANVEFLMSERNQGDAYSDLETMADR